MNSDDFGRALLGSPPLEKAASFFIRIKTAGWQDAPDESGELEGQFAVPIEQVIYACGAVAKMLMELKIATDVFEASARGPETGNGMARCSWGIEDFLTYLMKRMATLGGPVHLEAPEMPPATTDFLDATKILLRKEQEILAATNELKELVGDENPMGGALQRHREASQGRIDDLWKKLPRETAPVLEEGAPPMDEMPPEEGMEGLEGDEGAPEAPLEEKTAGEIEEMYQKVLKQRGKDRAVSARASKTEREKSQRGERFGRAAGAMLGGVGGAAAGRKFIGKGAPGTIAGLAAGMMTGGTVGKEVGKEVDIKKSAAAMARAIQKGTRMAGPDEARAVAERMQMQKYLHKPERLAREASNKSAKDAFARMRAKDLEIAQLGTKTSFVHILRKMAEEGMGGELGATPMAPPASSDQSAQESAKAYLQAETIARQAQEGSEIDNYKQRLQAAVQENQGLQQMAQQTQQQLMQVQQQAQEAQMQIEQTTQQAVQANDVATQQSQQAANMRMGMQQMRAQMLQIASQEPDAIAQQQQQEQAEAQAQQLATELQPPAEGAPAEGAPPIPATPQKAEQEAAEAQKAQGQAVEQTQQAQQAAEGAQQKMGSVAAHMGIGAALGAAGPLALAHGGEQGLQGQRDRISSLEGKGGFVNAMRMAKAKAHLATSEVAVNHPVASALAGAAGGAMAGRQFGKQFPKVLENHIQGAKNVGKHGIKSLFM